MKKKWPKYAFVFFITAGVFAFAWYISIWANKEKIDHLQNIQDKIATDILSSETQFDLLQESDCSSLEHTILSDEIASLADKISYSERNFSKAEEIMNLKKQYSILEIKDFLLAKRIGAKCKRPPVTILYFYGTKEACPECSSQSYVLDALRAKYNFVRVYAFDRGLDLSSVKALKSIYKVGDTIPTIVVNGVTLSGFQDLDKISTMLP